MKALYICENLLNYLSKEKVVNGFIHSIFNNACNIETKDNFITLLKKGRYMAPMSIVLDIDEQSRFNNLGLKQNDNFSLNVNDLNCNERNLYIDLKEAKVWYPGIIIEISRLSEREVLNNLRLIEAAISIYNKSCGFELLINLLGKSLPDLNLLPLKANIDDTYLFISDRFIDFIKAAAAADNTRIADKAQNIIGFGLGLTPSMDDFINGFMISLIYLGNYYNLNMKKIFEFNNRLVSKGLCKTTKVSSEMLRHASAGKTNESVRNLMLTILHERNEEKLIKALVNTINFGETSGSDTALGVYVGCKMLTNFKYRKVWESEAVCGN